jgi:hypothetical protein
MLDQEGPAQTSWRSEWAAHASKLSSKGSITVLRTCSAVCHQMHNRASNLACHAVSASIMVDLMADSIYLTLLFVCYLGSGILLAGYTRCS